MPTPEDDVTTVLMAISHLWTPDNLVALADLRDFAPVLSTARMNTALLTLRKTSRISLVPFEGRHGSTQAQRDACITEGNDTFGYLARR